MKRSILLLLGLAASFSACAREAGAPAVTQGAATTASAPEQVRSGQAADLASGAATASPTTLANVPASSAGTVAASAPDADGSDDVPVGTTSLEKIADLPAQHQLPGGKWQPGVNYDP